MSKNPELPPVLVVELTRAEAMAMNVAMSAGLYPELGYPAERVKFALKNHYASVTPGEKPVVFSHLAFYAPIQ